jgi:hypothetical protein
MAQGLTNLNSPRPKRGILAAHRLIPAWEIDMVHG